MKLIELHVSPKGIPFLIDPNHIVQIGTYQFKSGGTYIIRSDGGEVDVKETYDELRKMLNG